MILYTCNYLSACYSPEHYIKYISIKLVKTLVDSTLNTTTISFTPIVTASYTNSYIDKATYYGPGLTKRV